MTTNDHGDTLSVAFFLISLALLSLFALTCLNAQTMSYDFGSGTGVHTSGESSTFLPAPAAGTAKIRVGTQGGRAILANPGSAALGRASEMQLEAPTGSSLNKFSLYDIAAGSAVTMRFDCLISGGQGEWYFFIGNGATYAGNTAFSGAQVFTGFRMIVDSTGAVRMHVRSGNGWSPINIPLSTDSLLRFDLYCNNRGSGEAYVYTGSESVAPRCVDIWLNGVPIADNIPKSALPDTSGIDSFMLYGSSSPANTSVFSIDEIFWSPTVAPQPLPVELTGFSAERRDNTVELQWETSTELNNYGFAVQRRPESGDAQWQNLVFIPGAGSSYSTRSYSYSDETASADSTWLYRLRQIDRDGSEEFSRVLRIAAVYPYAKASFDAPFPNPARETTTFRFHLSSPARVRLLLYSSSGSRVFSVPLPCLLPAGRHAIAYRCADLPRGLYYCVCEAEGSARLGTLLLL